LGQFEDTGKSKI